ncbi:MAG TPA: glyoxalase superfamily protein [Caulobacteraceae bacterium]|jgi:hypothetical protein
MRDFRDAKAMAHTLRESLAAKALSISHSESLELVSRMLGAADWNTLSAMLQDRREAAGRPEPASVDGAGGSEEIEGRRLEQGRPRTAVPFEPQAFDRFVGFYGLSPTLVFTVTRDGDRFFSQLTGQTAVEFFPESGMKFFAKVVAAQISFVTDAKGRATALILHQNGMERRAPRIDPAEAEGRQAVVMAKFQSQVRDPETEPALRRHIEALVAGAPLDYETMGPDLAAAAKEQRPRIEAIFATLGSLRSVVFVGCNQMGLDVYNVWFENGVQHWSIRMGQDGLIETLFFTAGP